LSILLLKYFLNLQWILARIAHNVLAVYDGLGR